MTKPKLFICNLKRADILGQIKVVDKLLLPDGDVHQCLIEHTKLLTMIFEFLSSKFFTDSITGPKLKLMSVKGKKHGVITPLPHDD